MCRNGAPSKRGSKFAETGTVAEILLPPVGVSGSLIHRRSSGVPATARVACADTAHWQCVAADCHSLACGDWHWELGLWDSCGAHSGRPEPHAHRAPGSGPDAVVCDCACVCLCV